MMVRVAAMTDSSQCDIDRGLFVWSLV